MVWSSSVFSSSTMRTAVAPLLGAWHAWGLHLICAWLIRRQQRDWTDRRSLWGTWTWRAVLRSLSEVEKERTWSLHTNRHFLVPCNNSYKFDSLICLGGNVDMAIWRPIEGSLSMRAKLLCMTYTLQILKSLSWIEQGEMRFLKVSLAPRTSNVLKYPSWLKENIAFVL